MGNEKIAVLLLEANLKFTHDGCHIGRRYIYILVCVYMEV